MIKTGGRQKGTPNKSTTAVKEALLLAFDKLGGVPALAEWAKENPSDFYRLWSRLLPLELKAQIGSRVTLADLVVGSEGHRAEAVP